jgi:manganese efflux pump family protein
LAALLLLALALGLDSFRASLLLGATRLSAKHGVALVLAFGVCDGAAPIVGLGLGKFLAGATPLWLAYLGPVAIGACGTHVLYGAVRDRLKVDQDVNPDDVAPGAYGTIVMGLPLSLSVDNFVAGFALGVMHRPVVLTAAVFGVASALLAVAGLWLGGLVRRRATFDVELPAGLALLALAVWLAVFD